MIQEESYLKVADNTGTKEIKCIRVLGGSRKKVASVGDIIVASVRKTAPGSNVKKGAVVKAVPSSWLPEGVAFIIKHKGATLDPVKLQNYHVRKDAQGFDGPVVEGRVYYDSFVLDAKKAGVMVGKIG